MADNDIHYADCSVCERAVPCPHNATTVADNERENEIAREFGALGRASAFRDIRRWLDSMDPGSAE